MKTLTYILLFAAMDAVPTMVLWAVSPTDSIRVWYPTLLSYLGEHLVASAATLLVVYWLFHIVRLRIPLTDDKEGTSLSPAEVLLLGLLYLGVDLSASLELAFIQSADGAPIRLWHTQTLAGYLLVREPVYVTFAALLLTGLILSFRLRRLWNP